MNDDEIRQSVREAYARIAVRGGRSDAPSEPGTAGCCGPREGSAHASCCGAQATTEATGSVSPANVSAAGCCGSSPVDAVSMAVGYSEGQLGVLPDGANLGLGCGNPTALASLKEGEAVLDLGSGGGIDCFLASNAVGPAGRVIGVDMTPEMISRARENARRGGYENVDFRLGEIENLPVGDNSVDAVVSNCVINLSPDKGRVFAEAYRALKPGGRVMVSDIVLTRELPEEIMNSMAAYAGCVAGASKKAEYLETVKAAGFKDVEIISEVQMGSGELEGAISSVNVRAVKPG